ncbi:hypothetical protein BLNAU_19060 [Blattamonas nauphoetae]|uniref:Uncharacterized protein n=1 Tax=Blattamonas nauphoetae TaxID=2049346 RepID=A0ABQ9X3S2_9EUKA|nr:hypothetical protein BLNAU_19060 [Blattamonas nauphoetae]
MGRQRSICGICECLEPLPLPRPRRERDLLRWAEESGDGGDVCCCLQHRVDDALPGIFKEEKQKEAPTDAAVPATPSKKRSASAGRTTATATRTPTIAKTTAAVTRTPTKQVPKSPSFHLSLSSADWTNDAPVNINSAFSSTRHITLLATTFHYLLQTSAIRLVMEKREPILLVDDDEHEAALLFVVSSGWARGGREEWIVAFPLVTVIAKFIDSVMVWRVESELIVAVMSDEIGAEIAELDLTFIFMSLPAKFEKPVETVSIVVWSLQKEIERSREME